jgi:hypothetical protein
MDIPSCQVMHMVVGDDFVHDTQPPLRPDFLDEPDTDGFVFFY